MLSLGFGLTAVGSFRSLIALAQPTRRAEVVAAAYVVSFVAFSVPAVAAGFAAMRYGLRGTMVVLGVAVVAMAAIAAIAAVLTPEVAAEPLRAGPRTDRVCARHPADGRGSALSPAGPGTQPAAGSASRTASRTASTSSSVIAVERAISPFVPVSTPRA